VNLYVYLLDVANQDCAAAIALLVRDFILRAAPRKLQEGYSNHTIARW
jgi:hypothetical protein